MPEPTPKDASPLARLLATRQRVVELLAALLEAGSTAEARLTGGRSMLNTPSGTRWRSLDEGIDSTKRLISLLDRLIDEQRAEQADVARTIGQQAVIRPSRHSARAA